MNAQVNLSENSKNILSIVALADLTSKEVAEQMKVALPVVTGSLAGLKKNGFIVVEDSKLKATEAGREFVGIKVVATTIKKGDRKAQAVAILKSMAADASRKDIMERFMKELDMSKAQASTYHYNLTGKRGIWNS